MMLAAAQPSLGQHYHLFDKQHASCFSNKHTFEFLRTYRVQAVGNGQTATAVQVLAVSVCRAVYAREESEIAIFTNIWNHGSVLRAPCPTTCKNGKMKGAQFLLVSAIYVFIGFLI